MKIWHDDVRKPPDDSWRWCRTNEEVQHLFLFEELPEPTDGSEVTEISLDHDLGGEDFDPNDLDATYFRGSSPNGDGYDLVKWMCENDCVPAKVTIHSWNVIGAKRMALLFKDYGHVVLVKPYEVT